MSTTMSDDDLHSIEMLGGLLNILPQKPTESTSNLQSTSTSSLSVQEDRIYDRQIRTWGYEAQQRMKASSILIVGRFGGLAGEISKNLTLAGIGQLTLCDNQQFTPSTLLSNFLPNEHLQHLHNLSTSTPSTTSTAANHHSYYLSTPPEQLTEAQISVYGLHQLNPNVKIQHIMKPTIDITEITQHTKLKDFSTVIAVGMNLFDSIILNLLVRQNSPHTHFFYCDIHNSFGIGFSDLNVDYRISFETTVRHKGHSRETSWRRDERLETYLTPCRALTSSLYDSLMKLGINIDTLLKFYKEQINFVKPQIPTSPISPSSSISPPLFSQKHLTDTISTTKMNFVEINEASLKTTLPQLANALQAIVDAPPVHNQLPYFKWEPFRPLDTKRLITQSYLITYFLTLFNTSLFPTSSSQYLPPALLTNSSHLITQSTLSSISFLPTMKQYISQCGLSLGTEYSPFCAILAGVISQEVLKTFQRKQQRIVGYNWLALDLTERSGECRASRIM